MKKIIHLSDLHFQLNWEEDQEMVLHEFFKDLSKQIDGFDVDDIVFIFSGDMVKAGEDILLYNKFIDLFDLELNKLKITKDKRYCVPGNHDASAGFVRDNFVIHEGIVSQNLNEKKYNDFIESEDNFLKGKFNNYKIFEDKFIANGIAEALLSGKGFLLEKNIGIYCLNGSSFSSGGVNGINDKGRLGINTRDMHRWINDCKASIKILVMHHSVDFLADWAKNGVEKILNKEFSLCLSGHDHDQSIFHLINDNSSLVKCSAPPLLTNKDGDLGYSIITVSESGVKEIQYRQWTKNYSFVSGVNFSNNDEGRVIIKKSIDVEKREVISEKLNDRLNAALRSFDSQPLIWIEPYVCSSNDILNTSENERTDVVDMQQLVLNPESTIIQAPPQYGLTCLAHYIIKLAWDSNSSLWLYLDAHDLNVSNIDKVISNALKFFGVDISKVACIVLDSWDNYTRESCQILQKISILYKRIPLIVMQVIDDSKFLFSSNAEFYGRNFNVIYLHALTRNRVRKVVSSYNSYKRIGDEDIVTSKVVADLEVLNIPRTPLNCLTLLKVSEGYFDESPINRTKMLEMILFLLFNVDGIPTYKTKPDLKDCEYVLGRYCEKMIRERINSFSRLDFLDELRRFCGEKLIDLEVEVVFDVLYVNNIVVKYGDRYIFRFAFWVYYFCANRMHHDKDFAEYMLSDRAYAAFPEIIEFYTGIDRNRKDALELLIEDLSSVSNTVNLKVGLPDGMNPYKYLKYAPSEETIEMMREDISEKVQASNLPDIIKDQYADKFYDPSKPYDQSVNRIVEDFSIAALIQCIRASSRALRNSDYVDPEIKRKLLKEIVRAWEQLSKVIFAISPLLAIQGRAVYDGTMFRLGGSFRGDVSDLLIRIIENIPYNIVNLFKKDIFSHKMGSLIYDCVKSEGNDLNKHILILLLIYERPANWKKYLEDYIVSLPVNSFFLYNTISVLRAEYVYSFAKKHMLMEIGYLIKLGLAKHEYSIKKPGMDKITKIPNEWLPRKEGEGL